LIAGFVRRRIAKQGDTMRVFRAGIFVATLSVGIAATSIAQAAPRVLFNGCAYWGLPFCLMMKATDGKTYQLIDAGPAFPPNTRVMVYANPVGDAGLCFAPGAKVVRFKVLPPGPC
jgi:hypothetical protein